MKAIEVTQNFNNIDVKENFMACLAILRSIFLADMVNLHTVRFLNYVTDNLPDGCMYDVSLITPIYSNLGKIKDHDLAFKVIRGLDVSSKQ